MGMLDPDTYRCSREFHSEDGSVKSVECAYVWVACECLCVMRESVDKDKPSYTKEA